MPRLKLIALEDYPYQHHFQVRVTDLNYGKHLGNDALVGLIHSCRVKLLGDLGFSEEDIGDGAGLIMGDLAVSFQAEAFLNDELRIESAFAEIKGSSFRLHHRVSRDSEAIALVEAGFVAFDYSKRKSTALPTAFKLKLEGN